MGFSLFPHLQPTPPPSRRLQDLSEEELKEHLDRKRYGSFELTNAVRPGLDMIPAEGYRFDEYYDEESDVRVPVLMAAVTRYKLFDVFTSVLDPLGSEVNVVLETSHNTGTHRHEDLYREHIDMPVLKSTLEDFKDLLQNDGCTGIAVLNIEVPIEVQLDEHKLLLMYGADLSPFEAVLKDHDVPLGSDDFKFITEAEHIHSSSEEYEQQFNALAMRLGLDQSDGDDSDRWSQTE